MGVINTAHTPSHSSQFKSRQSILELEYERQGRRDFGLVALIEIRDLGKSKTTSSFGTPDYIVSYILFGTANGYSF